MINEGAWWGRWGWQGGHGSGCVEAGWVGGGGWGRCVRVGWWAGAGGVGGGGGRFRLKFDKPGIKMFVIIICFNHNSRMVP